ncbi:MAG: hypothetical protein IPM98_19390 [Lewinellaceae bacterium]|nr:hypothetical protein [Lewinellaceae bacterium]
MPTLQEVTLNPQTNWIPLTIPQWYNHGPKEMLITTGKAVWYHAGKPPVPIRWVLIKVADGSGEVAALLSTNVGLNPLEIINYFIHRWTMEVMFEEARANFWESNPNANGQTGPSPERHPCCSVSIAS